MKNIFKYITYTLCLAFMVSCGLEEMVEPSVQEPISKNIEFIARPTNFISSDVATKASADLQAVENSIYSAYFLVYDSNGRLLRYKNLSDKIDSGVVPSQTITTEKGLTDVTVCYIANLPEYFVKENMRATPADGDMSDLEKLKSTVIYFHAGTNANPNSNTKFMTDFKMELPTKYGVIGMPSIDPYDEIGKFNENCIPMLGVWKGNLTGSGTANSVEVQVKRLLSKVTFTIELNLNDAYADPGAQYNISSIVVKNIPKQVTLFPQDTEFSWVDENGLTKWLSYQSGNGKHFLVNNYSVVPSSNGTLKQGKSFTFTAYVPEYIIDPEVDECEKYKGDPNRQWFKPLLFGRKTPPFVEFEGILSTKGQDIALDYKIYLGENNFDSFSHKRNYHYKHNVLLHGISRSGGPDSESDVYYDHRVDMSYNGFLVGFQRATLLDSHFEVRPLRVKFDDDFITENQNIGGELKVEIVDPENHKWIRLERPLKEGDDYCPGSTKRKYFTTNLLDDVLNTEDNKVVTYDPFDIAKKGEGDLKGEVPIWVYVDEWGEQIADPVNEGDKNPVREATIKVTYTPNGGGEVVEQEFVVKQRAIYPIPTVGWDGVSRTYGIEYFEEYLYNYDEQDNYGAEGGEYYTDQSGVVWGFDGVQISDTDKALYYTSDGGNVDIDDFINYLDLGNNSKYDFYLTRDKDSDEDDIIVHDYNGYEFNNKIIITENINQTDLTLSSQASSAIEYCYNKNKRTIDGDVIYKYQDVDVRSEEETITEYYKIFERSYKVPFIGTVVNVYSYYSIQWTYDKTTTYTYEYTDMSNFKWYVPAIDELEDIVINGMNHDFFSEVFVENLYWSSQPAYDRNFSNVVMGIGEVAQRTSGAYMSDNLKAARATKYDVASNSFISSDIIGENEKEGYLNATTFYGINFFNMPSISYPNETSGVFVKDIELEGASSYHLLNGILAVTNYKKLDGVTDIPLPTGIQPRTSKHRVRCIYNPTPPIVEPKLVNTNYSGYVLRPNSRTVKNEGDVQDNLTVSYTTVTELPTNPQNPPQ